MIIISFGVYHIGSNNIYENVIMKYKAYNVRPFAFITDAYVFSWFWDNMYTLLILMLLIHVANLFLLYKICEKIDIKLNAFCIILFAFAPILIEALYWISASTRIVFSLFLCLLSIYLLIKSFDEESKVYKLFFFYSSIFLNLICVGFYEQTIAVNLFLFLFVLICLKKYKYIFIPAISTIWIGVWYLYFMANGQMQERGALNLSGIINAALECIKMISNNFKGAYSVLLKSFDLGMDVALTSLFSIIIFVIIAYTLFYIYKNKCTKDENKKDWRKFLLGITLYVSPFLPFLVLSSSFIAMRNMYLPLLGLAIILECILDWILKFIQNETFCNVVKTMLCGFFIVLFVVVNINATNNYKKVHDLDNKIAKQILKNIDDKAFEEEKTVSLNYDIKKIDAYKNITSQIYSIVEVDWAAMGKIQVERQDLRIGMFYINSKKDEADYVLYFDEEMNLVK